ncbi:ABZJ_00895 family protein [Gordonia insulae]|nr:ABZJ_00895 family protein [Gordonia insulae]
MSLGRYIAWFVGSYVVLGVVLAVVGSFLDIGGGVSAIVPMLAASTSGGQFVKDHGRVPTPEERRRLIWMSFAVAMIITILALAVVSVASPGVVDDVLSRGDLAVILTIALVVGALLTYLLIWFGYGWMTRRALVAQDKRQARTR